MKVAYILGAGASWQCIPTYIDFTDSLKKFVTILDEACGNNGFRILHTNYSITKEDVYKTLEAYKNHSAECKYFGTPDTYAVSLRNQKNKLDELKKLISSFLYFIQIDKNVELFKRYHINEELFDTLYNPHSDKIKENCKHVERVTLDRRYISLFSSILSKQSEHSLNDICFITWNYDFQLEKALKLFVPVNLANDFISKNVVQLNGSCKFRQNMSIPNRQITEDDLIKMLVYLFVPSEHKKLQLNFSWEHNNLDKALSFIENSKCIVMIGYSVPDYNRNSDTKLVKKITESLKKIYIQDQNPAFILKKLASIDKDYFRLDSLVYPPKADYYTASLYNSCELVDFTSQFIIPEEYW